MAKAEGVLSGGRTGGPQGDETKKKEAIKMKTTKQCIFQFQADFSARVIEKSVLFFLVVLMWCCVYAEWI